MTTIIDNQAIHTHLIGNKDFLKALKKKFSAIEVAEIIEYSKNIKGKYPKAMDHFYNWFGDLEGDINVLSIAWDSEGWGSGGSGVISFSLVFGLVKMSSSDYDDDHIEIFDKNTFSPWAIEHLMNDSVDITSDIYSEAELISIAEDLGIDGDTVLTVNDKVIKTKKRK